MSFPSFPFNTQAYSWHTLFKDGSSSRSIQFNHQDSTYLQMGIESSKPITITIDDQEQDDPTDSKMNIVRKFWQSGDPDRVLNVINKIQLTRSDFATLKEEGWLNDKIIDAYFQLIMDRSLESPRFKKVYAFTTYFYSALESKGFSGVSRWTSKVDIFLFDILLVPINSQSHWTLLVFNVKENRISYLDSMFYRESDEISNSMGQFHMQDFVNYLEQESMDKRGIPYDSSNLRPLSFPNLPFQLNEFDCGVFICQYANDITKSTFNGSNFSQEDSRSMRRQICYELGVSHLLY